MLHFGKAKYFPLLITAIILAGCASTTTPPLSNKPQSTTPTTSIQTGHISSFSYSYPANWSTSKTTSEQESASEVIINYGKDAEATLEVFPSFVSGQNDVSLSSATSQLTAGVAAVAVSQGLTIGSGPAQITIAQKPGLSYILNSGAGQGGAVALTFSGSVEGIIECAWQPAYTAVGQNACNEIVGTLAPYQSPFSFF